MTNEKIVSVDCQYRVPGKIDSGTRKREQLRKEFTVERRQDDESVDAEAHNSVEQNDM